jgi:hypothetical protein
MQFAIWGYPTALTLLGSISMNIYASQTIDPIFDSLKETEIDWSQTEPIDNIKTFMNSGQFNSMYGKTHSIESKLKNSETQKRLRIGARPDVIAKSIAARTGLKRNAETKAKMSKSSSFNNKILVCRIRDRKVLDLGNFTRYP